MEGMITVPAKHFVINKQDKIACDMYRPFFADSSSYKISSVADMFRLNRYSLLIFHIFLCFRDLSDKQSLETYSLTH